MGWLGPGWRDLVGGSGPGWCDLVRWLKSWPARPGGANQPSGEADGVGADGVGADGAGADGAGADGAGADGAGDDGGWLGPGVVGDTELDGEPGLVAVELGVALGFVLAVGLAVVLGVALAVATAGAGVVRTGVAGCWVGRDARTALAPVWLMSLSGSAGAAAAAPAADDVCARAGTLTAARDVPAWVAPAGPLTNWITTGP